MTLLQSSPLTEVWVAIDTETTGLDAEQDQIIEVGAVKFRGDEVLDVFQSFVNPGRQLSSFIKKFTGIAQKDVDRAPPFSKVGRDLLPFIGVSPVVGHNVGFDLGFLRSHGLPINNALSDTYDLAQVFLPSASEYSLGGLAKNLGIPVIRAHRAIDDAKTTRSVFLKLLEIAAEVDLDTLRQMESIVSKSSSALTYPLRQMVGNGTVNRAQLSLDEPAIDLRELAAMRRLQTTPSPRRTGGFDLADLKDRLRHPQALRTNGDAEPIDVDETVALLAEDGPIAVELSGFEERTEQIEMTRAVTEAINEGQRLIVEAGTGVGKSLAYLLPAVLHAVKNNKRVVISTNTINLQEQLMTKDIPMLVEALSGVPDFSASEFKYALLKGRANYLCLKRWTHLKNGDSVSDDDARLLSKVLLWLDDTSTGDRSELNVGSRNYGSWNRMSAQGALDCNGYNGVCFLRASRARAAAAHLVVVNHALLLTDLITGGTLIPDYDVLIIDEAHHLESEATKHLGFELSQSAIAEHLQMLTGDRGLVNRAKTILQRASAPVEKQDSFDQVGQKMTGLLPMLRESMASMFAVLDGAIQGTSSDGQQMRVTNGVRRQPHWSTTETVWENVNGNLADMQSNLSDMGSALDGLDAANIGDYEGLSLEVANSTQTNAEIRQNLEEFAVTPKEDGIYWVDRSPRGGDLTLSAAPLHVGEQLESLLYSQKRTVIMTSATLSTNGKFDHIRERTGFADSEDLLLGSPFDYPNAALLCVPTDMPEPSAPGYVESAAQAIVDAAVVAGGRTMALFTSYASLRDTARAVSASMQAAGLELLVQGSDGSPYQIVRRFLENPKSVILGTSSFWEGVDLPGDSLQVLVVMRLPFNVPTEPVFEARSELYDNSFMQYALPQAILRLRQGFGRLIRTKTDRGVAIILDQRIVSRRYGSLFVRSLPPASRKTCKLDDLSDELRQWLHK
jgi:DNA polymerase-3 subunit epsilon/ATP-dependent DNA helicase DinG